MTMLERANAYIAANQDKVNPRYRPLYHAVQPIGWLNDPNGFHFDGEYYHLFYQYYPYAAHWRSKDLVHWENLPVAMALDQPRDAEGCFFGTAKPDGKGGAYILYTGVTMDEDTDLSNALDFRRREEWWRSLISPMRKGRAPLSDHGLC